jgi:UDP-N-acetylglucosamine 3-dehydrogenase
MLRAGIIGCGAISERRHGPMLLRFNERVQIAALADISEERTALLGQQLGVSKEHQYQDYQQMLARETLDLVHICTPHSLHEAHAVAAMQAGAHVLLEKPMATTLDEVDRMNAAARQYGRKLTISHNQLFAAASRVVKQQIETGAIGKVFLVRDEGFGGYQVVGRGVDRGWRATLTAGGGGPLIDSGYHQVYRAVDWAGAKAKRVFARIGTYVAQVPVEDMAILLIEHENGATTSLQIGWCAPGRAVGMHEVMGSTGQMRIGLGREQSVEIWQQTKPEWAKLAVPLEGPDELGFSVIVDRFLRAIETDGPVPVTGEESRHILSIVLSAYESGRTGQPVDVA